MAADGTVASHVVAGANAIRSLVRAATCETAAPARPPVPAIGTAAPEVHLTSLSGDPVDLRSFRGADAVVLFWNPSCGFCKAMLAKLRAWDEERAGDTSLLVVSSGSSEANVDLAEMGSAVVLDGSGATMRAFGATGTPMAIRIDADGLVASAMQIGSEAVLGMLGAVVAETVT